MTDLQPVRGTRDLIGDDLRRYAHVVDTARRVAALYGFDEWATPIFEDTRVFSRTLGETSDVVTKEMYTFTDRGGDSITLRPEFTAGICRALVSNGLTQSLPQKVFSAGPMFRYERPQKGRYRQFHQIDCEIIGSAEPLADAEVIACGWHILQELGIAENVMLELNTLGDRPSRDAYRAALVSYFSQHREQLSAESLDRLERNPLRILDSKDSRDKALIEHAPTIAAYLTPEAAAMYAHLQKHLLRLGVPYRENPGASFAGSTITATRRSSSSRRSLAPRGTVMAGGRYDGLVEEMGGPPTPAVGWAAGIERLAMLLPDIPPAPRPVAVVPVGEAAEAAALDVLQALRQAGIRAEIAYRGNLRRRMERANRISARAAVILGEAEIARGVAQLRDLATGTQVEGTYRGSSKPPAMSFSEKLDRIAARADELRDALSSGVTGEAYVRASRELAEIEPVVARIDELHHAENEAAQAESLLADPEMHDLAEAELSALRERIPELQHALRLALLPKDEADERSAILEVRPAAGGDEAGLFAAELFAMYQKYAALRGWRFEVLDYDDTGLGGIKSATAEIVGRSVFARLKYESGVHRVQRVPANRNQGRIHTSTATVAVLPEAGSGRRHREGDIAMTSSRQRRRAASTSTRPKAPCASPHLPTGIVVAMQDEKSQHKNKAKAMKILARPAVRAATREPARDPGRRRRSPGRHRRPQRAHPHLQLPARPRHRPPHRADALQARPGHAGRPATISSTS